MFGYVLLTAQFTALGFCLIPLKLAMPNVLTQMLLALTLLLGIWVLWVNRPKNWSVLPQVLPDAHLITSGPYGLVRHPMYTTLLLLGLSALSHNLSLSSLGGLCALIVVLRVKAGYEEQFLIERFEPYQGYCRLVRKRFIPGLY